MASWDEIKKLAADLHRVQLGDSAKKLSERNCIEVVANLIDKHLIDVVYSLDGKEYITRQYLRTQIVNETLANDGRVSLVDLQQVLNVQYQNIENEAKHVADSRSDFTLCLGQLISRDYFEKVFSDIDQKLQDVGRLTLSDITKCFDLPTDLLIDEITQQLGKKIRASVDSLDSSVLYTDVYVQLQKAVIRGALTAVTKPIQVGKLISELNIEPGLFFVLFDDLLSEGHVKGSSSGGRILDRSVFIPDIYVESTERFIKNFYFQNLYVELPVVKKLSNDPKSFLKKLLGKEADSLVYLANLALSPEFYDQVVNNVELAMKQHHWVDIKDCVPLALETSDLNSLVNLFEKKHHKDWILSDRNTLYQKSLTEQCLKIFEPLCIEKAAKESVNMAKLFRIVKNPCQTSTAPENKKTKGGGGKKKKGAVVNDGDADDSSFVGQPVDQLIFMHEDQLVKHLKEHFDGDGESHPDDVLRDISTKIYSSLNALYREKAESVYVAAQSTSSKKSHSEFNERFRVLYQNICLFDTSTSIFSDLISEQLKCYLLKSLCNDLVNLAFGFYCNVPNAPQLTPKVRDNTIDSLSGDAKSAFLRLVQSLNGKDLNQFFDAVDEISASNICSLNVKRPDKRMKLEMVNRYHAELLSQLKDCADESAGLLISCLLLIKKVFTPDIMIHASGKFVPQMVALLHEKIPKPLHFLLTENQKLVVQKLKSPNEDAANELKQTFKNLKQQIINIFNQDVSCECD